MNQKPLRFNRKEAEAKLGRRVRTILSLEDIPAGTRGNVMQLDEIEVDGYELIVEWDSLIDGKRQHDWFTKEEYHRCLVDSD